MKPLIAVVAALTVVVAAAVAFAFIHRANAGPDPFAGSYPMITPAPSATNTEAAWQPTGPPKGPLPAFRGQKSKVIGRIVDRTAHVSYARFGKPWHRPGVSLSHTGGQEFGNKGKSPATFWYAAVYSGLLEDEYRPAANAAGPNRLRAAAELTGRDFQRLTFGEDGRRTELAGAPLTLGGHRAWVTAFRLTHTGGDRVLMKSQTEVAVAVDAGASAPAIVEVQIPSNKEQLLPDINTVVRSIRVV